MSLFRNAACRELDTFLAELRANLENNYKDTAHEARRHLGSRCEELFAAGKLSEKEYRKYRILYESYTEKMKDYHH